MKEDIPRPQTFSRGWGRRIAISLGCMLLLFAVLGGAMTWRKHRREKAIASLRSSGFMFNTSLSLRSRIMQTLGYRYLLQPAFWKVLMRGDTTILSGPGAVNRFSLQNLDAFANDIGWAAPSTIELDGCDTLENLDALKGVRSVRALYIQYCPRLRSIEGIAGLKHLQFLTIGRSESLSEVGAIAGLTELKYLRVEGCQTIRTLSSLRKLSKLESLALLNSTALEDLNGIEGLRNLKAVNFNGCHALKDASALKALKGLQKVFLIDCDLSEEAVKELKAALPGTTVMATRYEPPASITPQPKAATR